MSPRKLRTRNVTSTEAESYLNKAKEFYLSMIDEHQAGRWNAAGLAAVHCAISASDAVLGKIANVRSAGHDHSDVLALLREKVKGIGHSERTGEQVARLSRILGQKNLIEYESREFRRPECESLVKDVGRYFEWAKQFFL